MFPGCSRCRRVHTRARCDLASALCKLHVSCGWRRTCGCTRSELSDRLFDRIQSDNVHRCMFLALGSSRLGMTLKIQQRFNRTKNLTPTIVGSVNGVIDFFQVSLAHSSSSSHNFIFENSFVNVYYWMIDSTNQP